MEAEYPPIDEEKGRRSDQLVGTLGRNEDFPRDFFGDEADELQLPFTPNSPDADMETPGETYVRHMRRRIGEEVQEFPTCAAKNKEKKRLHRDENGYLDVDEERVSVLLIEVDSVEAWMLEKCHCPEGTPPMNRKVPGENVLRCFGCLRPYRFATGSP